MTSDIRIETGPKESKVIFTSPNLKQESFRFKKIFDENSTQVEIFETVGKPLIENTLKGYNSTILSYGQTGTGKTYTMTGEFDDPDLQGLIPRTIEEIFNNMKLSTEISISYFEIYNEHVYDLIKNDDQYEFEPSESGPLSETQSLAFRNLSQYKVSNIDQALALLIRGESRKMLAQTSSNERSSRSHTIFAIGLKIPHCNGTYVNPVLLLVDLAGSENLSKCKGNHNFFETRYINLSLHYLEQVLLALRRPNRIHVPYRNSLMTTFLKNSLGGSCITAVIATFSIADEDIQETRQTCRFAVNVAHIKNELKANEDVHYTKKLEDLEREVRQLRTQLHLVTKEEPTTVLTLEDKEACVKELEKFLHEGFIMCLPLRDPKKVQFCFHLLRKKILKMTSHENEWKPNLNETYNVNRGKPEGWMHSIVATMEMAIERNWRNQKHAMELPKVNISYQNFEKTENVTEKENVPPKKSNFKITESESTLLEAVKGSKTRPRLPVETAPNRTLGNNASKSREIDCKFPTKPEPKTVEKKTSEYFTATQSFNSNPSAFTLLPTQGNIKSVTENHSFRSAFIIDEKMETAEGNDTEKLLWEITSLDKETTSEKRSVGELKEQKEKPDKDEPERNETTPAKETDQEVESEEGRKMEGSSAYCRKEDKKENESPVKGLPLTGDQDVDEEIIKFYKSRYEHFKDM